MSAPDDKNLGDLRTTIRQVRTKLRGTSPAYAVDLLCDVVGELVDEVERLKTRVAELEDPNTWGDQT